jgi:hypothetical protein
MDSTENKPEKTPGFKELKVKFKEPGPAIFSNNMTVQRDETVAYVSFYQTIPPLILDESVIEALESIEAMPIVRVALPLSKLGDLIGALKTVHETLGAK